jgi:hypothetical protein
VSVGKGSEEVELRLKMPQMKKRKLAIFIYKDEHLKRRKTRSKCNK